MRTFTKGSSTMAVAMLKKLWKFAMEPLSTVLGHELRDDAGGLQDAHDYHEEDGAYDVEEYVSDAGALGVPRGAEGAEEGGDDAGAYVDAHDERDRRTGRSSPPSRREACSMPTTAELLWTMTVTAMPTMISAPASRKSG